MQKYEDEKFTSLNDIGLWQLKICALIVQRGLFKALEHESKLDVTMVEKDRISLLENTHNTIVSNLGENVLRQVSKENIAKDLWKKLESL